MGLKYRAGWAAALIAMTMLSLAGAGVALGADLAAADVVTDGVVTVNWVDPDDGPIAGAQVRLTWYHDGDPIPGILPAAVTDAAGDAVFTGVPRAVDGSDPVLLDIRGDLSTAVVDEAGCTTFESWLGLTNAVASNASVDVALATETKSISVNCPEPTPPPDDVDPTPTPDGGDPTPTDVPPSGGVLGAVGTPGVTLPATDAMAGEDAAPAGSPFVPVLLAVLVATAFLVPAATLALARARLPR